jgi:hypothetical protein
LLGGEYVDLPRTVVISIINFKLFSCAEYRSEYQALEVTRHDPLMEEGKKEIARNALAQGATPEFVQKITGLDIQTISSLK